METQDIVEVWSRKLIDEGRQLMLVDNLVDVYETRFGAIPPALRAAIEQNHDEPTLRAWLKLAITRSPDEIAAAIHASRAS